MLYEQMLVYVLFQTSGSPRVFFFSLVSHPKQVCFFSSSQHLQNFASMFKHCTSPSTQISFLGSLEDFLVIIFFLESPTNFIVLPCPQHLQLPRSLPLSLQTPPKKERWGFPGSSRPRKTPPDDFRVFCGSFGGVLGGDWRVFWGVLTMKSVCWGGL